MGDTKRNGQDSATIEMTELLRRISDGITRLHSDLTSRLDQTNAQLAELKDELAAFKVEIRGGFAEVRTELREIHHEIADTSARLVAMQDHEARIARLEATVEKLTRAA